MKIKDLTKEALAAICDRSKTYNDILRDLGVTISAGNRTTVKKYLKYHGIIFNSQFESLNVKRDFTPRVTEDIFKKDSMCCRSTIKKMIIKDNIFPYLCSECGCGASWQGKPITLQLDHINGVSDDNRIENLRFLCPNCHSQTETFGGKRFKKVKQYKDKQEVHRIQYETSASNRKVERPSYDALLTFVADSGYLATGKKYGVSDNAVRKWIKMYEKYELKKD